MIALLSNKPARTPAVGDRVYYPGDMANLSCVARITMVDGQWFSAKAEDSDRKFRMCPVALFTGLRPWRFMDELEAERAAAIKDMTERMRRTV